MMRQGVKLMVGLLGVLKLGLGVHAQPSANPYPNEVSMTIVGGKREIRSNGIPNHPLGSFPRRGNPNRVLPQTQRFRVALAPVVSPRALPVGMNPFGVALNGVVFEPAAAEWWNRDPGSGWQYEALSINLGMDQNNAHVQPTGMYHYHGMPRGLLTQLGAASGKMTLLGWAADGFPIYGPLAYRNPTDPSSGTKLMRSSFQLRSGTRDSGPGGRYDGRFVQDFEYVKGTGDLDEFNGRNGVTPEFPKGTYYYCLTEQYPYIPRSFKGVPDDSFLRRERDRVGVGRRGSGVGTSPGRRRGRSDGPRPDGSRLRPR